MKIYNAHVEYRDGTVGIYNNVIYNLNLPKQLLQDNLCLLQLNPREKTDKHIIIPMDHVKTIFMSVCGTEKHDNPRATAYEDGDESGTIPDW